MTATIYPIIAMAEDRKHKPFLDAGQKLICEITLLPSLAIAVHWKPEVIEVFKDEDELLEHIRKNRKQILENYGIPSAYVSAEDNQPHS